jgi:ketosteroid isomerase-like protein
MSAIEIAERYFAAWRANDFDLHTAAAPACPVANWTHVENGRITRVREAFDPRPLLPPD